MNLHDYLIERASIGPRRELSLVLRTPMNIEYGEIRFSAIKNQPTVEDWVQSNENELSAANDGRILLRVEALEENRLASELYEYQLMVDLLDPLVLVSRRVQVKPYNNSLQATGPCGPSPDLKR